MYYSMVAEAETAPARSSAGGLPKPEIAIEPTANCLVVFVRAAFVAAVPRVRLPLIVLLLTLFGLRNVSLTLLCTAGTLLAFAALYALVYAMTARAYYKIVK